MMAEPISNWKENENGKINPNTSFMFPPCFHLFHCVCVLRLLSKRGFALADVCLLKKRTCMLGLQQLQRHHVETDRTMIGHLGLLVFSPTKFLMQVEIVTSKIVIVGKKKGSMILPFSSIESCRQMSVWSRTHFLMRYLLVSMTLDCILFRQI